MGLLDDAIREHLELKRQRGADPGEVAREEHEALDVPGDETSVEDAAVDLGVASAAPLVDPSVGLPTGTTQEDAPATDGAEPEQPAVSDTAVAGETAELDMSSVLGGDEQGAVGDQAPPQEDSLEWEMPGEAAAAEAEVEEPADDVLEETPDFLRDTPEQERLWFEQRPPRDFDFDK